MRIILLIAGLVGISAFLLAVQHPRNQVVPSIALVTTNNRSLKVLEPIVVATEMPTSSPALSQQVLASPAPIIIPTPSAIPVKIKKSTPTPKPTSTAIPYPSPAPCTRISLQGSPGLTAAQLQAQTEQYKEDIIYHYYAVHGSTKAAIREQLSQCGLLNSSELYYAATLDDPQIWYWSSWDGTICSVGKFVVHETTDFFFAKWGDVDISPQEPALANEWANYIESVRIHEDGHRQHGILVSNKIMQMLSTVTAPTCEQLNSSVNTQFDALLATLPGLGAAYDASNNHGITQLIHPNILDN